MTLQEFKAWFEGYTEGLEGAPTKAQFDRIKEKVKEITGAPITERVYIDWYRQAGAPYWTQYPFSGVALSTGVANFSNDLSKNAIGNFDGIQVMYALGKAEAVA